MLPYRLPTSVVSIVREKCSKHAIRTTRPENVPLFTQFAFLLVFQILLIQIFTVLYQKEPLNEPTSPNVRIFRS